MIKIKTQRSRQIISFIMLTIGSIMAAFALENFLIIIPSRQALQ